jgi:hypothetical protein
MNASITDEERAQDLAKLKRQYRISRALSAVLFLFIVGTVLSGIVPTWTVSIRHTRWCVFPNATVIPLYEFRNMPIARVQELSGNTLVVRPDQDRDVWTASVRVIDKAWEEKRSGWRQRTTTRILSETVYKGTFKLKCKDGAVVHVGLKPVDDEVHALD